MKIMKVTPSFFLLMISFVCLADKLEKGLERLHMYDYFNAKELFEQSLPKKTAGAAYGLSVIYSSNNNPFYNLDSARHYILVSDSAFLKLEPKEKDYYRTIGVTAIQLQALRDSICEKAFTAAEAVSTIGGFNNYLQDYSFCTRTQRAVELRNVLAYKDAKSKNTSVAYRHFIDTYPGANDSHDAMIRYNERIYDEATSDKKIASYEKYLGMHPESPYKTQAENMIYTLSTIHKTIEEYHSYIKKYPVSRHSEEAWREIFKLYTKDYNEQVLTSFKNQFPDYPFKNELETDYELQRSFFLPFTRNNLWGFINEDGKEMIKPEYEEVAFFSEGLAAVQKNGKYGYVNKSGKTIMQFSYDDAEPFKNNTAIVTKNEKSGLINRNGEELIPVIYDNLSDPVEGFYVAVLNGKTGYITKQGDKLTEFAFDFAGDFKDGYAIAGTDDKFGLLNNAGSFIIEQQYDELLFLSNGLLKAKQNGNWGVVNMHGDVVASFVYDAIGDFGGSRALVVKNKKCGFIDEQGKVVIPVSYPFQESLMNTAAFKNGYVVLKQKMKSVLLDSLGAKISLAGYEDIGLPSEGMIPVKKNKKWGFADMNGKIKIACTYNDAGAFENGFAKIKIKKLIGVIDHTAKLLIPASYEDVTFKNDYFIVKSNGKSGLMSRDGASLLPCEFDRLEFLSDKIVSAVSNENLLYENLKTGKVIWKEKD